MEDVGLLGKNIRALRNAYGETQQELAEAIHVTHTAISNYEANNRHIDRDTVVKIAKHFSVTAEELLKNDFSTIGKIEVNAFTFWEKIEYFFPIVSSEDALKSFYFKKAFERHKTIYDELHTLNMNAMDWLYDVCIPEYLNSYDEKEAKEESAINFIASIFLLKSICKIGPEAIKTQPAFLLQTVSKNPKYKSVIYDPDPNIESNSKKILEDLEKEDVTDLLEEMMIVLKRSNRYGDVADYYLAAQYEYNLVDNGLDSEYNQRIGAEMIRAFASVGNAYAIDSLKIAKSVFR